MALHPDFRDLRAALADAAAEYLIIGGHAVAFHARPRFTKDIDLWIGTDAANAGRVELALTRFGVPDSVLAAFRAAGPDEVVWLGSPPLRVDILRQLPPHGFEGAWARRVDTDWDGVPVHVIGLEDLIELKRRAGRDQDLLDVKELEGRRSG
jgi:hypothetical protein